MRKHFHTFIYLSYKMLISHSQHFTFTTELTINKNFTYLLLHTHAQMSAYKSFYGKFNTIQPVAVNTWAVKIFA